MLNYALDFRVCVCMVCLCMEVPKPARNFSTHPEQSRGVDMLLAQLFAHPDLEYNVQVCMEPLCHQCRLWMAILCCAHCIALCIQHKVHTVIVYVHLVSIQDYTRVHSKIICNRVAKLFA